MELLVFKPPSQRLVLNPTLAMGPDPVSAEEKSRLIAEIQEMNAFAAETRIDGCAPVIWRRVFHGSLEEGGRWIAVGGGSYQNLPKHRRQKITINGGAVVEVDVRASHLTCLHGIFRAPFDPANEDPYAVDGIPREVVKAWISATLGNGNSLRRWPLKLQKELAKRGFKLASYPNDKIKTAVLRRYPVLNDLEGSGINSSFLMGMEAKAITAAMLRLKRVHGVLALPVHDSLVVSQEVVEEARDALRKGYQEFAGVTPLTNP